MSKLISPCQIFLLRGFVDFSFLEFLSELKLSNKIQLRLELNKKIIMLTVFLPLQTVTKMFVIVCFGTDSIAPDHSSKWEVATCSRSVHKMLKRLLCQGIYKPFMSRQMWLNHTESDLT